MCRGARLKPVAQMLGLTARTIQRWALQEDGEDRRHGPVTAPANKLTPVERQEVLSVANSPTYREMSPKQIVPRLADEGRYVASESPSTASSVMRSNYLIGNAVGRRHIDAPVKK